MKITGRITETARSEGRAAFRTVNCGQEGCVGSATSSDHWAFGVLDRHTHLAALRQVLGEACRREDCPHHGVVLATPSGHYPPPISRPDNQDSIPGLTREGTE